MEAGTLIRSGCMAETPDYDCFCNRRSGRPLAKPLYSDNDRPDRARLAGKCLAHASAWQFRKQDMMLTVIHWHYEKLRYLD